MVFGNMHTKLKAKPEHIEKALKVLQSGKFYSPDELRRNAGLTLTAVKCVIQALELENKIEIKTQQTSPKLTVKLKV